MTSRLRMKVAVALFALGLAPLATSASAMPRADALAAKNIAASHVETVQYRGGARWRGGGGNWNRGGWRGRGWYGRGWYGRGYYGPGWGWGVGAGFVGGAILGSALAAPYYYGPGYYAPGYYYAPPPGPARRCWVRTDDRGYGYWGLCR
ncbi:MAG TPA: hypothetical protein VG986_18080 [Pseudolabrys sp.]|nr:hypothetical protein [Pseudolabrys sp.]